MCRNAKVDLRPLAPDDGKVIASWGADDEFCRAADWTVGLQPDEYLRFHRGLITDPPASLVRLGAVVGQSLVGYVDLHGDEATCRELGFVVGERCLWGRGIGTAAAAAGLRFGFVELGLTKIWAEALDANNASVRILQRLGMRETGIGGAGSYLGTASLYRRFSIVAGEFLQRTT